MKKHVLNVHVAPEEHEHLKEIAKAGGLTLTMALRLLILSDMDRKRDRLAAQARTLALGPEMLE